jgi:GNAT superfamily N-acetyltransferase
MTWDICALADRPEYGDLIDDLSGDSWPQFLLHGDASNWGLLFDELARYQLLFVGTDGKLLGVGHTAPLTWDGTIDDLPDSLFDVLARSHDGQTRQQAPNTICALAALVARSCRGQGLSVEIIHRMISLAAETGCDYLIAPVRPMFKDRYPLVPMNEYVHWTAANGETYDPWIRVHVRLGGEILNVVHSTLKVTGTVSDWESWTGMVFPGSGQHIVPGALVPVEIDRALDMGTYHDPNVWMKHVVNLRGDRSA